MSRKHARLYPTKLPSLQRKATHRSLSLSLSRVLSMFSIYEWPYLGYTFSPKCDEPLVITTPPISSNQLCLCISLSLSHIVIWLKVLSPWKNEMKLTSKTTQTAATPDQTPPYLKTQCAIPSRSRLSPFFFFSSH